MFSQWSLKLLVGEATCTFYQILLMEHLIMWEVVRVDGGHTKAQDLAELRIKHNPSWVLVLATKARWSSADTDGDAAGQC